MKQHNSAHELVSANSYKVGRVWQLLRMSINNKVYNDTKQNEDLHMYDIVMLWRYKRTIIIFNYIYNVEIICFKYKYIYIYK